MPILLIVILVVYLSLFRSFTMGSTSMSPTLAENELLIVFKWYPKPTRGDLVAFTLPRDPGTVYVKRLIGMPGDRIQMVGGHLHINGQPVQRARIEDYVRDGKRVKQWSETLPNGVIHRTIDLIDKGFFDQTPVYNVPEGHYFMMGDNRDNSSDSRVTLRVGTIPRENLVGFAFYCARSSCK
jgi:signal peptidase I